MVNSTDPFSWHVAHLTAALCRCVCVCVCVSVCVCVCVWSQAWDVKCSGNHRDTRLERYTMTFQIIFTHTHTHTHQYEHVLQRRPTLLFKLLYFLQHSISRQLHWLIVTAMCPVFFFNFPLLYFIQSVCGCVKSKWDSWPICLFVMRQWCDAWANATVSMLTCSQWQH